MRNGNIILRYIRESDIDSYIRWTTTETEWSEWDAPWETDDGDDFVARQRASLSVTPKSFGKLEIDTDFGQHVGWVSSYCIDGNKEKTAVGIDVPPRSARGKGYGKSALSLFMAYLFSCCDKETLYTQTWSGNTVMLRLAEKIGFNEIERIKNIRIVRGDAYDALTFSISRAEFFNRYPDLRNTCYL